MTGGNDHEQHNGYRDWAGRAELLRRSIEAAAVHKDAMRSTCNLKLCVRMSECVRACLRACVQPCMQACECACV